MFVSLFSYFGVGGEKLMVSGILVSQILYDSHGVGENEAVLLFKGWDLFVLI